MFKIKKLFIGLILLLVYLNVTDTAFAEEQSRQGEYQVRYKAQVISVGESRTENIPGTDTPHTYQSITAKVLNKDKVDKEVVIKNDYILLDRGDVFYLDYASFENGSESYVVGEVYRLNILIALVTVFVLLVVALGGKQGAMSLLSLCGSFLAIIYILFPGIVAGYNPMIISGLLAICILFLIMYVTHGFNRMTTAAFLGCFVTISLTIILSYISVVLAKLTGFSSDESVYLNFNTNGVIDFQGLLLGAIIIGVIGIIDDITITQASIVAELRSLKDKLSTTEIFTRSMRIGRDHMGAVVNSLVLAYTGASLPLLLLVYRSDLPISELLNQEIIATEIVRTLVGSIGLTLAVPISTLIAIVLIRKAVPGSGQHGHVH